MLIEITQSNYKESLIYLNDELLRIINDNIYNINNIISNGNICMILQDTPSYKYDNKIFNNLKNTYYIGTFNNLLLNIDALQLWSDNIIYLRNNDDIIIKIEIIDKKQNLI